MKRRERRLQCLSVLSSSVVVAFALPAFGGVRWVVAGFSVMFEVFFVCAAATGGGVQIFSAVLCWPVGTPLYS